MFRWFTRIMAYFKNICHQENDYKENCSSSLPAQNYHINILTNRKLGALPTIKFSIF